MQRADTNNQASVNAFESDPVSITDRIYWKDLTIIAVLILLNSVIMVSSSSVMDTARDVYYAWQIATGAGFPLEGSLLAGSIHSGPLWFYILAIPVLFSKSWIAISLWVGFLSGMKFPLAYACGNRLGDRKFGLIWACLLALPNWTSINYLIFTHINLIETTVLLSIYSLIRWQQGERNWFLYMCMSLGISLHAHASVYALSVAIFPMVIVSLYRKQLSWRYLGFGILLAAAPLLPYLLSQSLNQWPDFQTTRSYFESQSIFNNLLGYFDILRGTFKDGPIIALRYVLSLQGVLLWLSYIVISLITLVGLYLAIHGMAKKPKQTPAKLLLAASLIIVASIALIREVTPYYMTLVMYPTIYGLIAWGWSNLQIPPRWPVKGIFATISLIYMFGFFFHTLEIARSGHLLVSGKSINNVRAHGIDEISDSIYFPAWARQQMGEFICGHEKPVFFHGTTSLLLEQSYGLEATMLCDTTDVFIGGKGTGQHYIGISRRDAEQLGIKAKMDTLGPISLEKVNRVIEPKHPEPLPDGNLYPPREFIHTKKKTYTIDFSTAAHELIAVTNLYHYWMPYSFKVLLNGKQVDPLFKNTLTSYFGCSGCSGSGAQDWSIDITAPKPELVEVVTFVPEYIRN